MNATIKHLAMLIEEAPRWARSELTASNDRVRAAAAYEIADYVAAGLDNASPAKCALQLPLPL